MREEKKRSAIWAIDFYIRKAQEVYRKRGWNRWCSARKNNRKNQNLI